MEYIDLTHVVIGVITLFGAVFTALVVPYIKTVLSTNKLEKLQTWVKVFVQAAEQLFAGSGRGEDKLQWVAERLREKGYTINIENTADAIRAMIEAAVLELKK